MEKLTLEHKQMITDAINTWIDGKNPERSQNKLAEGSKVNAAYISLLRDGKYTQRVSDRDVTIGDSAFHRLADFLDVKFEGSFYWNFIRNTDRIMKFCRKMQIHSKQGIIDGPTGQSKTFTLEKYSKKNNYVVYIKLTQNMTPNDLVNSVMEKLDVKGNFRSVHSKLKAISGVVVTRKHALIFDEVEVVKNGIYAVIKDVSDAVKDKASVIMCGVGLIDKLDSLAKREKPGFPQLRRRFFGNIEKLSSITVSDVIAVCDYEGLTNREVKNIISFYCQNLDHLSQWIDDIKRWQKVEGRKITAREVEKLFDLKAFDLKAA